MTYQVIARKWRPQNFDELIGQFHISNTLKNAIVNDRLGHAFLFTGVRGVGKTTTARILAKRLSCENPIDGNPCNNCSACNDVQNGKHIDIIEIDGASNTGVEDVKILREAAKYLPSRGKYKVYIIDEVHMLSEKAFNALLKTLEEPPAHVKFIFATTDPHKIPITIKSRCQIYDFRSISLDEIFKQLKLILDSSDIKYEDSALYLISKKAEGSMRDAQSLLEQVIAFASNNITKLDVLNILGVTDSDVLFEMTDAILKNSIESIILIIDKLIRAGINLSHFYKELIEHFHSIMIAKNVKEPFKVLKMPTFEVERYIEQSKKFDETFVKRYQLLIDGFDILKSSQFKRISFEMNMIKIASYQPVTPLKDILKFVNKLSKTFEEKPDTQKIEIDLFGMIRGSKEVKKIDEERKERQETQIIQKEEPIEPTPNQLDTDGDDMNVGVGLVPTQPMTNMDNKTQGDTNGGDINVGVGLVPTQPMTNMDNEPQGDTTENDIPTPPNTSSVPLQGGELTQGNTVGNDMNIGVGLVPTQLPSSIDYDSYKNLIGPFFESIDGSYQYFYQQVKLPIRYENSVLYLEYPTDAEVLFGLHPNFKEKYLLWLKENLHENISIDVKLGNIDEKDTFFGILNRMRRDADKQELKSIRDLEGVRKIEEVFNLKVKKIIRSKKDGKDKD